MQLLIHKAAALGADIIGLNPVHALLPDVETTPAMGLEREILLKDVCYRYGTGSPNILDRIHLKIAKGTCNALVGTTGQPRRRDSAP